MTIASHVTGLVARFRFHLRPLRQRLREYAGGTAPTWDVTLGPITVGDRTLRLRTPTLADGDTWRQVRLRDRERIEPWWDASPLSWEQQHTARAWHARYLTMRREGRRGRSLPLMIEVDGRCAGQMGLETVDLDAGTGELGAWLDGELGGRGIASAALGLLLDYAFYELGLVRVTAPVAVGNRAAAFTVARAGFVREGTMRAYREVGLGRLDHDLWAITRP